MLFANDICLNEKKTSFAITLILQLVNCRGNVLNSFLLQGDKFDLVIINKKECIDCLQTAAIKKEIRIKFKVSKACWSLRQLLAKSKLWKRCLT